MAVRGRLQVTEDAPPPTAKAQGWLRRELPELAMGLLSACTSPLTGGPQMRMCATSDPRAQASSGRQEGGQTRMHLCIVNWGHRKQRCPSRGVSGRGPGERRAGDSITKWDQAEVSKSTKAEATLTTR